ncbi:Rap family tetratricopeptide repeat protein [Bacillus thuringiensis]|uniref:Rap family tetratricopeptide repeat protein n=1 Tax=Bacillus thuringiensis TaxID=1428 RepID=UPI0026E2B084|nr:Rap family tetratricopeptide repeat protein [Bacillus thuringiensis]MDO6634330.1 tetratricopeptide repeat protein [Bacillus thuringiensis]MDO6663565.1 tetratricopeptide repeat protein [Bacillus thuringiensis]MDO6704480.1 tetratricopeptide repeat protein [Bacillus thuringiensis]
MSVQIVSKKEITKLLNDWYQEMRIQHVLKAEQLKKDIDSKIDKIEENQDILIYYSLLDFRYKMLMGNFEQDLSDFESISGKMDTFLEYYYHFFKFIYAMEVGNYSNAKKHCELAEELLIVIPDEAEKAEFNYRVALFHYYLSQPLLAIHYATKAQEFFSKNKGYEVKTGACKNTLGMSCITLEQFELAEEYLILALDIFTKVGEHTSILKVRHNLGLLYADQNFSELAIRYLSEVFQEDPHVKTNYLLAREHCRLNHYEEANCYIAKGLESCDKEYYYHFSILKSLNENVPVESLENLVLEAISYFKNQKLWKDVQLYAEELAAKWYDIGAKEKAGQYFYMSYEAKKILKKRGALK